MLICISSWTKIVSPVDHIKICCVTHSFADRDKASLNTLHHSRLVLTDNKGAGQGFWRMNPTPENLQHLANFLGQTLSPDPTARKGAEAQLNQAKVQPGYPLLLLRLVGASEPAAEIRLQGAIQLKNLINNHWIASESHDFSISDADKAAVKAEIVSASMTVPEKLQPFLSESLSTICNADFPLDQR